MLVTALTAACVLISAETPDQEQGRAKALAALEQAYAASPSPAILLAMAEVQSSVEGQCREAKRAYERFFEACSDCSLLPAALEQQDALLVRCPTVPDVISEAAARRKTTDPLGRKALERLHELLGPRSPAEVTHLRSQLALAKDNESALNRVRRKTWQLAQTFTVSAEEAEWFLDPLLSLDESAYRTLTEKLGPAKKAGTRIALGEIEVSDLAIVQDHLVQADRLGKKAQRSCIIRQGELFGYVNLRTTPPSNVFFGEELIGETPLARVRLPAGCVILKAKDPKSDKEKAIKIFVEPNVTARYAVTL